MWKTRFITPPPRIEVLYRGQAVAELTKDREGRYLFRYLSAFIALNLAPLPGLPVGKEHIDAKLFPFFQERIPELCRPEVLQWLDHHAVQTEDKMGLLGTLGKKSVTDSFELRLTRAA